MSTNCWWYCYHFWSQLWKGSMFDQTVWHLFPSFYELLQYSIFFNRLLFKSPKVYFACFPFVIYYIFHTDNVNCFTWSLLLFPKIFSMSDILKWQSQMSLTQSFVLLHAQWSQYLFYRTGSTLFPLISSWIEAYCELFFFRSTCII